MEKKHALYKYSAILPGLFICQYLDTLLFKPLCFFLFTATQFFATYLTDKAKLITGSEIWILIIFWSHTSGYSCYFRKPKNPNPDSTTKFLSTLTESFKYYESARECRSMFCPPPHAAAGTSGSPIAEAESAHVITILIKWKVQPSTLELSPAQPFPEEWEARRQLQLGRNTHDPSQHLLSPYVIFPKTVAKTNPSCADLNVSAVPAHSQPQPLQLPYPRVCQKREDPKICEKASAEGTAIPRIWRQILLLNQGIPTRSKMCAVPI